MHQIFTPEIFSEKDLTCPKCAWNGTGSEAVQEDLFLTDAVELYCPSCNYYFGFVTANDHDHSES